MFREKAARAVEQSPGEKATIRTARASRTASRGGGDVSGPTSASSGQDSDRRRLNDEWRRLHDDGGSLLHKNRPRHGSRLGDGGAARTLALSVSAGGEHRQGEKRNQKPHAKLLEIKV